MNGRARPREYEHNNNIPLEIDSVVEAKSKIDPRIGPIQGVQPNAKAIPKPPTKTAIGRMICFLLATG